MPGSPAATRGLDEGRRAYSAVAMDRGDLDLAASLAPVGSVQAVAVEELRKRRACGEAMREELEKSAEKWGIAFLSSPDSVVLVQVPEGIVLEANQKFEILTGWARQEVVGRTTMEIALWANEDDRQSTLRLALENGFYDNFETTFRRKDGTLFPVLLSCRLLDINGRKVAVANARDITELHTQRAELRRANDRLARAQALAGLGIWELDTATRGLWWSEETFKLAGMPPGDGTPDFDVYLQTVVEADRALLLRALAEAELHGNAFQVRIRHHRPDGTLNHVVARGEPVLDDGRVVQVLGSVMAIPEPK